MKVPWYSVYSSFFFFLEPTVKKNTWMRTISVRVMVIIFRKCYSEMFLLNIYEANWQRHLKDTLQLKILRQWINIRASSSSNIHNYETTSPATCKLFKPSFRTNLYGKHSITINAIDVWNKAQTSLDNTILKDLTFNKIKTIIMKRMIDSY